MVRPNTPMDDIVQLVLSLAPQITLEPQVTNDILRFNLWIGHFTIEIYNDQIRYAFTTGERSVEGFCDSLESLRQVLFTEVEHLQQRFAQEQSDLPGSATH